MSWTSPLRPFLLILKSKSMRRYFTFFLKSFWLLRHLMMTLVTVWFVYAFIGKHAFQCGSLLLNGTLDTSTCVSSSVQDEGLSGDALLFKDNFNTGIGAVINTFVLLTTENYPQILFSAEGSSHAPTTGSIFYFSTFLIITNFLVLPIVLSKLIDYMEAGPWLRSGLNLYSI